MKITRLDIKGREKVFAINPSISTNSIVDIYVKEKSGVAFGEIEKYLEI